jgi:hypothetical protein
MKTLRRIWKWIKSLFQKEKEPEALPDGREDFNSLMNDWYGALWEQHVEDLVKARERQDLS